jgi:hypothetical protein
MNLRFPVVLAWLLSACEPSKPPGEVGDMPGPAAAPPASDLPPPPIPMSDVAGRSGQDSQTWFTDRTGATNFPRLMYSSRGSDEMSINIQCREPDKLVILIIRQHPGDKPKEWPFTLVSGATSEQLAGIVQRVEDDQLVIEVAPTPKLRIFEELQASGQLTLKDSQGDHEMNAINEEERRAIGAFFETCASSAR